MPLLATVDHSPRLRFALASAGAIVVSLLCLLAVGHWFAATPKRLQPAEKPLEMRLVELEPPSPSPPPPQRVMQATGPQELKPVRRADTRRSTPTLKPAKNAAKETTKPTDPSPIQPQPTATTTTPAPAPRPAEQATAPAPEKSAPQSAGDSNARAIAQPLPNIPDDLREDAYQATALARFTIHTDGTVDVDLVKPTPNPRLNQLLLEALHRWRFFPAMQSGHPMETHQDIRVHFNVN